MLNDVHRRNYNWCRGGCRDSSVQIQWVEVFEYSGTGHTVNAVWDTAAGDGSTWALLCKRCRGLYHLKVPQARVLPR